MMSTGVTIMAGFRTKLYKIQSATQLIKIQMRHIIGLLLFAQHKFICTCDSEQIAGIISSFNESLFIQLTILYFNYILFCILTI